MKFKQHNQGFSLVEVFVAITILLLVSAGPMKVLSTSNKSTSFASEQIVAYFLAQEGLEIVQMGRDHLVLGDFSDKMNGTNSQPDPWVRFQTDFTNCLNTTTANGCGLLPASNSKAYTVTSCSTLSSCRLYLNASNASAIARYTHTATNNTITPYTRTIKIAMINNADGTTQGAVATSTVTWRTGSLIADQKVELVTYLTNVYETN